MWFYKGIKLNILATKQKTTVTQNYKINPIQITTIIVEYTKNSLNSVSYMIEIIQFKNFEKFSPIERQNWHFLKCHGYCYTNSVNCSYAKASKAAIDCSYIYCEGEHNKVLQTHVFFQTHTLMFIGVINLIGSIPQNKKPNKLFTKQNYHKNTE